MYKVADLKLGICLLCRGVLYFIINDPSKLPVNEDLCRHLNRFLSVKVLLGAAVNKQGGYC